MNQINILNKIKIHESKLLVYDSLGPRFTYKQQEDFLSSRFSLIFADKPLISGNKQGHGIILTRQNLMHTDGITDCTQTSGDRQLVSKKRSCLPGDLLTRRAETAARGYATQVQQSSNRKKPRTPLIPTHHPDWTRGRGGGNLTLLQRLPVQMMCWIFPGTSMDLNLAGRSGARCGTCRSPSANTSTILLLLLKSLSSEHYPPSLVL
jgi:hypothetical protein